MATRESSDPLAVASLVSIPNLVGVNRAFGNHGVMLKIEH
jgi:hypothetical protein